MRFSEGHRLERALNFLRSMAFSYAQQAFYEIEHNTLIPERRPRAAAVAKLMKAYALWDQANFGEARRSDEVHGLEGGRGMSYVKIFLQNEYRVTDYAASFFDVCWNP